MLALNRTKTVLLVILALTVCGCGKTAAAPETDTQATLARYYGDRVAIRFQVSENEVVCGYAYVPDVLSDFAFLVEDDRLWLFTDHPERFDRCGPAFVAPRLVSPIAH